MPYQGRFGATLDIMTMLDFNLWSWNSRVFPGIDSLNVRLNDKVRIRVGNLTMTNHPMHLHGHEFQVTGTDGGPTPKSARWPEVTTDIAVGQMRQFEFLASEEGDWAFHCHKSHHTMNAMGHDVPTMIGVDHRDVARKISNLIPDYMVMGERGMADKYTNSQQAQEALRRIWQLCAIETPSMAGRSMNDPGYGKSRRSRGWRTSNSGWTRRWQLRP